jgi:hypothetical protein
MDQSKRWNGQISVASVKTQADPCCQMFLQAADQGHIAHRTPLLTARLGSILPAWGRACQAGGLWKRLGLAMEKTELLKAPWPLGVFRSGFGSCIRDDKKPSHNPKMRDDKTYGVCNQLKNDLTFFLTEELTRVWSFVFCPTRPPHDLSTGTLKAQRGI